MTGKHCLILEDLAFNSVSEIAALPHTVCVSVFTFSTYHCSMATTKRMQIYAHHCLIRTRLSFSSLVIRKMITQQIFTRTNHHCH